MRIVLVYLLVVASVTAVDQPAPAEARERPSPYPAAGSPVPQEQQSAGYRGASLNSLRQEQRVSYPQVTISPVAGSREPQTVVSRQEQPSLVISRQEQPSVDVSRQEQPTVVIGPQEQPAVVSSTANPLAEGLSAEALERIEQKTVEQTSNNIDEQVHIPVPTPYTITYERRIPVTVNRPVPVSVPRAVPVQVSQPYPVEVPRAVPVAIPRPVPVSVPYAVPQPYAVPHPFVVPQTYSVPDPQPQTYSAPFFPQYAQYAQYSLPAEVNYQSARIATPLKSSSEFLSNRQLETVVPTQASFVNAQAFRVNAPALAPQIFYNGAPSYVSQPSVYSTARPILAQPSISLQQPTFSFQQPLLTARQLNVELSPLSPTTVAPITLDAINTAVPTALPITLNTVAPTPLPITFDTVHSTYDGPSHAYLPPESIIKKK